MLWCWSGPAVDAPAPVGEAGGFPGGLLAMTQRVPLSLLLLLMLRLCVATATDRDPGPVSAFFFSCTILWRHRLQSGHRAGLGPSMLRESAAALPWCCLSQELGTVSPATDSVSPHPRAPWRCQTGSGHEPSPST